MANPPGPVFIGLDGYFILIFLQKSGFRHVYILTIIFGFVHIFIGIFQKNKL